MRLLRRRESGAVATYAAVLDGIHLWLDVEGPVAVRDESGTVTALGPAPCDLSGLTASSYDVLAGTSPLSLEPVQGSALKRTPLSPDGLTQWEVIPGEPLRLARRTVEATAELDAVDVRGDRVRLRIQPHDGVEPGGHLLLLDADDHVRATLPVTAHEGLLEAVVGVDDLPAGYVGMLRPVVGTEARWVRIRRRANDLADPHHAVLLPELYAEADRARARFRWNPDGLLALRSIDPDEVQT
jgi:hypothetical protein